MRGNPIKEWIIFSALWLLLLIPVIKLTVFRKSADVTTKPHHETTVAKTTTSATAILRYTGKPVFIKITQNNQTLCNLSKPSPDETELDLQILMEEHTTELLLQAEWPDEEKHVFEIGLIAEEKEERSKHYWAEKVLDEAVSFSWH